jgi:acyl dehydratase
MTTNGENAYENFKAAIGTDEGAGEWMTITQERINAFADATDDHQFIHVDPEAAAQMSPWGVPIAHGFLTLSLLTPLCGSLKQDPKFLEGIVMGVNYGFEKVRFVNAVKVNSRIRANSVVAAVEQKDANTLQVTRTVTVEIEGETKPALVADWITRLVYA